MRAMRPVAGVAAAVGLWWLCVAGFGISPFFLPAPPDVAAALTGQFSYLLEQAGVTLWHMGAGFTIATAAGLSVAVLLAAVDWLRDMLLPLLVAVQAVPKVVFAPLLLLWLGYGPASKITLVALVCFLPVVVSTLAGLVSTPAELDELSRSLAASRWHTFRKVRIPYALPQVFTGLKLAVVFALIGAVVAQITTPNVGLGAVVVRATQVANTSLAFAAITLLAGIGISSFYGMVAIERLALPWARATTAPVAG